MKISVKRNIFLLLIIIFVLVTVQKFCGTDTKSCFLFQAEPLTVSTSMLQNSLEDSHSYHKPTLHAIDEKFGKETSESAVNRYSPRHPTEKELERSERVDVDDEREYVDDFKNDIRSMSSVDGGKSDTVSQNNKKSTVASRVELNKSKITSDKNFANDNGTLHNAIQVQHIMIPELKTDDKIIVRSNETHLKSSVKFFTRTQALISRTTKSTNQTNYVNLHHEIKNESIYMSPTIKRGNALFEKIFTTIIKKVKNSSRQNIASYDPIKESFSNNRLSDIANITNSRDTLSRHYRMFNLSTVSSKIDQGKLNNTILDIYGNYTSQGNASQPSEMNIQKTFTKSNSTTSTEQPLSHKKKVRSGNGLLVFDQLSCHPIRVQLLLYNRIFKTGSSTLENHLVQLSSLNNFFVQKMTTEDWYSDGDSYPYPESIEYIANKRDKQYTAFTAHFYFRKNLDVDLRHTYINVLREPVQRVVSHYFYMRNTKLRPPERITELKEEGRWNESLTACVTKQRKECEDNVMTAFFCGPMRYCKQGTAKALHKAKANMQRYYAAIGLTERLSELLEVLKIRIPMFFYNKEKNLMLTETLKKSHLKNYLESVPERDIELIRSRNQADIVLYEFAKQIFEQQLHQCKKYGAQT